MPWRGEEDWRRGRAGERRGSHEAQMQIDGKETTPCLHAGGGKEWVHAGGYAVRIYVQRAGVARARANHGP